MLANSLVNYCDIANNFYNNYYTVNFDGYPNPVNITLSPPGPSVAGDTVSLMCSVTLVDPVPLPTTIPCPSFEWFFGPNGTAPLPSGVTARANFSGYTFISTLEFPPLNESHAGMYTCQIGAGMLANSLVISVDGMLLYLSIIIIHYTIIIQDFYLCFIACIVMIFSM